jgi:hypothetical protein
MRYFSKLRAPVLFTAACSFGAGLPLGPARADDKKTLPFIFVEDIEREIEMIRGPDRFIRGKFDHFGNFIPRAPESKRTGPEAPESKVFVANRPSLTAKDRAAGPDKEAAYEFRSKVLIPGTLNAAGTFVPTIGEEIIEFKEYKYSPESRRIWNLPGYFMRRDKLEERIKWLREHARGDLGMVAEMAILESAIAGKK